MNFERPRFEEPINFPEQKGDRIFNKEVPSLPSVETGELELLPTSDDEVALNEVGKDINISTARQIALEPVVTESPEIARRATVVQVAEVLTIGDVRNSNVVNVATRVLSSKADAA